MTLADSAVTSSDVIYRCSNCGCDDAPSISADALRGLPVEGSIRADDRWRQCPDDGPEFAVLVNPDDHTEQWERWSFERDGRTIRTCIRCIRSPEQVRADGRRTAMIGRAIPFGNVIVEWAIREHKARRGSTVPDLGQLWMFQGTPIANPQIARDSAGNWMLVQREHQPMGDWAHRLLFSPKLRAADTSGRYLKTAYDVVAAVSSATSKDYKALKRSCLHVPFDLRFSIEEQWIAMFESVRVIQQAFLGMAGQTGVFHPDPDLPWRDAYTYLLVELLKLSTRQVADEVFRADRNGMGKVRSTMSKVRNALRKARTEEA